MCIDLEEAIRFLDAAKGRLAGKDDAIYICRIGVADEVRKKLEYLQDVEPKVYANLSKALAGYYRRKEDHENFSKSGLQYLANTSPADLTNEEKKDWSIKMGMAVLLGKNIYNILELV